MATKRRSVVLPGQNAFEAGRRRRQAADPSGGTQARGFAFVAQIAVRVGAAPSMDDAHDLAASTARAARHRVSPRRHAIPGHRSAGLAHMFGQGWHF